MVEHSTLAREVAIQDVVRGRMVDALGLECDPNISVGERIPVRTSAVFAAVSEFAENTGGPSEKLEPLRNHGVRELGKPTGVEHVQVGFRHRPARGIESVDPPPVVFGAEAETPVLERQVVGEEGNVGGLQSDAWGQGARLEDGREGELRSYSAALQTGFTDLLI